MKTQFLTFPFIVFFVGSSSAVGQTAWFTLENSGSCFGLSFSAGPGQPLFLSFIDTPGPSCTFQVGYNLMAPSPMSSYAFELSTPDSGLFISNPNWAPGMALGYDLLVPTVIAGAGPGLLLDVGGISSSGTGGNGLLHIFDVSVGFFSLLENGESDSPQTLNIFGDFGSNGQTYANGYLWYGQVGPNPPTFGMPNYDGSGSWGPLPVITIVAIPEPATVILLGLGALALIRQRR